MPTSSRYISKSLFESYMSWPPFVDFAKISRFRSVYFFISNVGTLEMPDRMDGSLLISSKRDSDK